MNAIQYFDWGGGNGIPSYVNLSLYVNFSSEAYRDLFNMYSWGVNFTQGGYLIRDLSGRRPLKEGVPNLIWRRRDWSYTPDYEVAKIASYRMHLVLNHSYPNAINILRNMKARINNEPGYTNILTVEDDGYDLNFHVTIDGRNMHFFKHKKLTITI